MDISSENNPNRLACHPGEQGARPSAGNQAEVEKLTTGINRDAKCSRTTSNESDEMSKQI